MEHWILFLFTAALYLCIGYGTGYVYGTRTAETERVKYLSSAKELKDLYDRAAASNRTLKEALDRRQAALAELAEALERRQRAIQALADASREAK